MAFSGMDKDERQVANQHRLEQSLPKPPTNERQASGIDFWRGVNWEKVRFWAPSIRTIMLENVSVDVVDGARVKGVLGVSVRFGRQGRG